MIQGFRFNRNQKKYRKCQKYRKWPRVKNVLQFVARLAAKRTICDATHRVSLDVHFPPTQGTAAPVILRADKLHSQN
jgi:hypothetical protein